MPRQVDKGIQGLVEQILSIPGTTKEWIARAVEKGLSETEARRRIGQTLWYYRKRLFMKKLPHGREQLVKVKEAK